MVSAEPSITHERRVNASQANAVHLGPRTQCRGLERLPCTDQGDGNRLRRHSARQDGGLNFHPTKGIDCSDQTNNLKYLSRNRPTVDDPSAFDQVRIFMPPAQIKQSAS